jgi:hypothetical protein
MKTKPIKEPTFQEWYARKMKGAESIMREFIKKYGRLKADGTPRKIFPQDFIIP